MTKKKKLLQGETKSWKMKLSNPVHQEACTVRKIMYGSVWFYTDKLYDKETYFLFARSSSTKLDELEAVCWHNKIFLIIDDQCQNMILYLISVYR